MNPGQMAMELRLAICNLTALANLPPRRVCSVGSFASRRGLGETWRSKPQRCGDLQTKSGEHRLIPSKGIADNDQQRRQRMVVAAAFPTALSAAVTLVVVGAAVATIFKNKEKLQSLEVAKEECGECNGSGLCPACNGEGFLLKNLTPEAAAKARSRALDAATRYTAGLAKKWSYCSTCSGTRSCPACRGQGFIDE
ncbi:hypothetical protein CY35_14G085300 [Sphagnum magellanicum]|nr:hypothetical protein CY35_14G085300 [Sphagnum magellanicum]